MTGDKQRNRSDFEIRDHGRAGVKIKSEALLRSFCFFMLMSIGSGAAVAEYTCNQNYCQTIPPVGNNITATVNRATHIGAQVPSTQFLGVCTGCTACPEPGMEAQCVNANFVGLPNGPSFTNRCNCFKTNPGLGQILKDRGVDVFTRYNIRYSRFNPLPASATRHLIVAFSGQNGAIFGWDPGRDFFDGRGFQNGGPSTLTGQPPNEITGKDTAWAAGCVNNAVQPDCGQTTFTGKGLTQR